MATGDVRGDLFPGGAWRTELTDAWHLYGGYFDAFARGMLQTHRRLQQEAALSARADQFLIYGPWTHARFLETTQGEVCSSRPPSQVGDAGPPAR